MKDKLPKFTEFMLPILKIYEDGNPHTRREVYDILFNNFTPDQLNVVYPSENGRVIEDRISWAIFYLRSAKALIDKSRGIYEIGENGKKLLNDNLTEIKVSDLNQFPEFTLNKPKVDGVTENDESIQLLENTTPNALISSVVENYNKELKEQILERIEQNDAYWFEEMILKLLEKMGYGRPEVTPKSSDHGFDGVIYEDVLGVGRIYTQAKRYTKEPVGDKDMNEFIGVLHKNNTRSSNGIFITTSRFTGPAKATAESDSTCNIVLIDGEKLVDLMIEYELGVFVKERYTLCEVDESFFN